MGPGKKWPSKAIQTTHNVINNDIVIMGSDGLFDNLYSNEMLTCFEGRMNTDKSMSNLDEISKCIAYSAEVRSYDKAYLSPLVQQNREQKGKKKRRHKNKSNKTGGRPDDITVIVAQIKYNTIE